MRGFDIARYRGAFTGSNSLVERQALEGARAAALVSRIRFADEIRLHVPLGEELLISTETRLARRKELPRDFA